MIRQPAHDALSTESQADPISPSHIGDNTLLLFIRLFASHLWLLLAMVMVKLHKIQIISYSPCNNKVSQPLKQIAQKGEKFSVTSNQGLFLNNIHTVEPQVVWLGAEIALISFPAFKSIGL